MIGIDIVIAVKKNESFFVHSGIVTRPQGVQGVPVNTLPCQQIQPGQPQQQSLGSPALGTNLNALGVLNQQGNRLLFPVQQQPNAQQASQQAQQQPQQQTQQQNVVSLPGPSPTTSNPGLSPFGNPLSQGSTTTSTNSQFPATSNGPVSLPQVSPAGQNSQSNQFSDMLKNNLMGPSPSSFVQQQQQPPQQQNVMTQQQPNQQAVTQNNTPRIPSSGADTITAQLPTSTGPKSASSSRGPSPAPATPIQSSPATVTAASMGKSIQHINYFRKIIKNSYC